MKESDKQRFDALVQWSRQHGAELHPALEVYQDHATGFSIRVKNSVSDGRPPPEPGFTAFTCPISTTLSYLNALVDGPTSLSSSLPERPGAFSPRFMESVPPHVIGRFFLVKEYLKGDDSLWSPYIATLPQPAQIHAWALPAFWPEDDADYLQGTNAHVAIDEIQANVKREFKQARRVLKEDNFPGWQDYTQMLYKWAFCLFTSRSFRPSLMLSTPAKEQVSGLLPAGCEIDDFSILQPLFDVGNHSMTSQYTWDVDSDPNCCQLVCQDAYQPGDQVYNNYGLKTNSELLLAYGFILPETEALHNDYVHVRKRQHSDDDTASDKPKDFLISLRPMSHPSSLAGLARLSVSPGTRLSTLPRFAHFEPALVDDLASVMAAPEEQQAMDQWLSGDGAEQPSELAPLVARITGALAGKLQYDYQRLMEAGFEGEEEGVESRLSEPANRHQQLAVAYRRQCEKVLLAALERLTGEAV
ncbi:SET domain-containing protein [Trichocladium antarcticum]|uniref:SET domain-containing protein n=1 Tax=Trichocladium antarcticum TaxID=1450529 RepID=A0AAN6UEK9_9PEZI|nr:SET domain-containing protein [Trichocladium antarcticum]